MLAQGGAGGNAILGPARGKKEVQSSQVWTGADLRAVEFLV